MPAPERLLGQGVEVDVPEHRLNHSVLRDRPVCWLHKAPRSSTRQQPNRLAVRIELWAKRLLAVHRLVLQHLLHERDAALPKLVLHLHYSLSFALLALALCELTRTCTLAPMSIWLTGARAAYSLARDNSAEMEDLGRCAMKTQMGLFFLVCHGDAGIAIQWLLKHPVTLTPCEGWGMSCN